MQSKLPAYDVASVVLVVKLFDDIHWLYAEPLLTDENV